MRLMKAIAFTKYGPPDLLKLREVEMPVPKDDEVLVKVHAASVNAWDWELLRGTPFINRLMFGPLKPKLTALGADICGTVEAVGRSAGRFKPGDKVFGRGRDVGRPAARGRDHGKQERGASGWCAAAFHANAPCGNN